MEEIRGAPGGSKSGDGSLCQRGAEVMRFDSE